LTYQVERNNNRLMWSGPRDPTTLLLFLFLKINSKSTFFFFFWKVFIYAGFFCVVKSSLRRHPLLVSIKSMINWVNRFCCLSNVICHTYENNSIEFYRNTICVEGEKKKFQFISKIEQKRKWNWNWKCTQLEGMDVIFDIKRDFLAFFKITSKIVINF
jgi:hypothetical protein